MEPVPNFDSAQFLPLSLLARRHGVLQRAMHDELRKARVRMIVIANQPQVLEADYRDWLNDKLSQATKGEPSSKVSP